MVSISFDISLIIQLINFLLLILVLNFLLYKPIRKILSERRAFFDDLRNKASHAKGVLESGEAEKARLNAESVRQAMDLKNEMKSQGLAKEKTILAEAQEKAAKDLEAARQQVKTETENARSALSQEVKVIAWEMAGKILGRSL